MTAYDSWKTTPPDDEIPPTPEWALEQAREELGADASDEQIEEYALELAQERFADDCNDLDFEEN